MMEPSVDTEKRAPGTRRGPGLWIALIVVAIAGVLVAAELIHIHYRVNTDPDFKSFCAMGEAANCETVAASSYSEVLGVPIAVWGTFAYTALLVLGLLGVRRRSDGAEAGFPGLVFLWSLAGLGATAALAYISSTRIESFCILCMALYAVDIVVFVLALFLARSTGGLVAAVRNDLRRLLGAPLVTGALGLFLAAVVVALVLFYPDFQMATVAPPTPPVATDACGAGYHTDEGFPLFGAPEAVVTIVEFSDYQCGHCRRAHMVLRDLVHQYHERVRLVHRHYPLDNTCNKQIPQPFHQRACAAAKAAICADKQKKFWEYNDLLFSNAQHLEKKHLLGYARNLGLDVATFEACLNAPETDVELQRDIRDAVGWGVQGTPSFVVNGQFLQGGLSEKRFRQVIDEALARCDKP